MSDEISRPRSRREDGQATEVVETDALADAAVADLPELGDEDVYSEADRERDAEAEGNAGPEDAATDGGPEVPEFPAEPDAEAMERLARLLTGLLFASETPLSIARLAHACAARTTVVRQALEALQQRLDELCLPFLLLEADGVYRLVTRPELAPHLLRLRAIKKVERLSPAALETLAVIAYRQPVMRAEVEAIRGVKAGPILRMLLDRKLIRVAGRADVPGRPVLYGTTKEFLDRFALSSPRDLPSMGELRRGQV
jgi:segregation and condensation protein B